VNSSSEEKITMRLLGKPLQRKQTRGNGREAGKVKRGKTVPYVERKSKEG